jgi:hypothetical protein
MEMATARLSSMTGEGVARGEFGLECVGAEGSA